MAWRVFRNWITSTDSPHKRYEQCPLKSLQCSLWVTPSPRVTTTMNQCVQWHMSHVFNEEVILLFLYFIEMGSFVSIFFSSRYWWFIHPVAYRYRSFIWMAVSISYRMISRFMLDGPDHVQSFNRGKSEETSQHWTMQKMGLVLWTQAGNPCVKEEKGTG